MSEREDGLDATDRLVRAAATELYAGPPAEFIATRTARVRSAKADGAKEAARRIGALRRPSVAAWALNQLVHRADPVIEELADLGARLRHATSTLDAAGIAGLRGARDEVLAALVAAAARVAADEGQKLTAPVEAEVRDTGIAALADEAAEAVLRSGTLTRALSYSGFGEVDVSEAAATTSTGVVLTSIPGGRAAREAGAGEAGGTEESDRTAYGTEPDGEEAEEDLADQEQDDDEAADVGPEDERDEEGAYEAEPDDEDADEELPEGEPAPSESDDESDEGEALAEAAAAEERERAVAAAQEAVEAAEVELRRRAASVDAARNRSEATRQRIQKLEQQLETARAEDEDALEKLMTAVATAKQADADLAAARARLAELRGD